MIVDDGWCVHHERIHAPMQWGGLGQAWEDVEPPQPPARPRWWWLKRLLPLSRATRSWW